MMAICGSSYAVVKPSYRASYYFSYYADPWGWATWRRAWRHCDHEFSRWPAFKARGGLKALAKGRPWHEAYWAEQFDTTAAGLVDTWDYQWNFAVIERNGLACFPVRNLVSKSWLSVGRDSHDG